MKRLYGQVICCGIMLLLAIPTYAEQEVEPQQIVEPVSQQHQVELRIQPSQPKPGEEVTLTTWVKHIESDVIIPISAFDIRIESLHAVHMGARIAGVDGTGLVHTSFTNEGTYVVNISPEQPQGITDISRKSFLIEVRETHEAEPQEVEPQQNDTESRMPRASVLLGVLAIVAAVSGWWYIRKRRMRWYR